MAGGGNLLHFAAEVRGQTSIGSIDALPNKGCAGSVLSGCSRLG
jgi:hypothetical protein